jgi:tRNA-dihydrouridine synthase A
LSQRAGVQVFIVHARNAWLQGLSPKENRDVPPLRHELVHRLKRDFPQLTIAINGGIDTDAQVAEQLQHVDGVMLGRHAYHEPWALAAWDARFFGDAPRCSTREDAEDAYVAYLEGVAAQGTPWPLAARHMLGLYNGLPGARRWRQVWSDHRLKTLRPSEVAAQARAAMAAAAKYATSPNAASESRPRQALTVD